MIGSQISKTESESIYLSDLTHNNAMNIKFQLGLAELIVQALILILMV